MRSQRLKICSQHKSKYRAHLSNIFYFMYAHSALLILYCILEFHPFNMELDCLICCESYTDYAKYGCGHVLCYKCSTRLLYLYKDARCPTCKESKSKPTFYNFIPNNFDKMELTSDNSNGIETNKTEENGRTSGENTPSFSYSENTPTLPSSSEVPPRSLCESKKIHPFEDNYAFYANPEIYKKVKDLLVTRCKQCKQTFQTKKDLVTHFKSKHSSLLCSTCLDNNHQFWYEYSNYAPDALTNHRKGLLNESGFFGHIYCYFCSFYLYNRDTAKIHCNQEHYLCTVCDILNVKFQYYKDFESLHAHYRSKHFCCSNSVCRSNLCYVYAYKSELWAHAMTNHGLEMNLSDICLGNEANPPVFSLFEKGQEQDEESLYGTDSNITNPLISNPFFPKFSSNTTDGSSNDSRQNVPVFLNRQIIHQEDSVSKQRINQVKYITSNFYAEISDSIGKYISGRKAVEDMVKEIEDCVGKQICLKILEGVPFYSKQKQIRDFSEGYKKELTFPTFKKTTEKVEENKKQKTGFRILDSSKFK